MLHAVAPRRPGGLKDRLVRRRSGPRADGRGVLLFGVLLFPRCALDDNLHRPGRGPYPTARLDPLLPCEGAPEVDPGCLQEPVSDPYLSSVRVGLAQRPDSDEAILGRVLHVGHVALLFGRL